MNLSKISVECVLAVFKVSFLPYLYFGSSLSLHIFPSGMKNSFILFLLVEWSPVFYYQWKIFSWNVEILHGMRKLGPEKLNIRHVSCSVLLKYLGHLTCLFFLLEFYIFSVSLLCFFSFFLLLVFPSSAFICYVRYSFAFWIRWKENLVKCTNFYYRMLFFMAAL